MRRINGGEKEKAMNRNLFVTDNGTLCEQVRPISIGPRLTRLSGWVNRPRLDRPVLGFLQTRRATYRGIPTSFGSDRLCIVDRARALHD